MKKRMVILWSLVTLTGIIGLFFSLAPQLGTRPKGAYAKGLKQSENYNGRKFVNLVKTPVQSEDSKFFAVMKEFLRKDKSRSPGSELRTNPLINKNAGANLRFTWLGHSTILLQSNGTTILTDPVFSKRSSPLSFTGTKAFEFSNNYSADDLPKIDVVLISHDHYDHLDYKTIKKLKHKTALFVVPLGVKGHLLRWGIEESKIIEKDWWQSVEVKEQLKLHCTPARHFSGRRGFDQNSTLWCSWAIELDSKKVFFSGDSGYEKHFAKIGERHGPFDLTFMECGQYNEAWPYIHMMPEQVLQAHNDLNGHYLVPIHWGKFKLSLHSWTEPVERLINASNGQPDRILTPLIGKTIELNNAIETSKWWVN